MNDIELIKGCLKHNHESMKMFYERFYAKMFGVCLRYAKNSDDAKEMLHEGFVEVFHELKNHKPNHPLDPWIKDVIILSCIDFLKKDKANMIVSTVNASKAVGGESKDEITDDDMIRNADKEMLLKAIQGLAPAYRKVYNLNAIDGYAHARIAEILNIGEQTSEQTLSKAQYELRKNIKELMRKK